MTTATPRVAPETRRMWYINLPLFLGATAAALSGMYFLFLPAGGFQGGRNPWYGVTVLFSRGTWDDLHTWSGIVMIAAAGVHLVVHRAWIARMARRAVSELRGGCGCMNRQGRINLAINAALGLTFIAAAVSGLVLLFTPHGRQVVAPVSLWSRGTWDDIHTWSGALMISTAVVHFYIHRGWVRKVTTNIWRAWRAGAAQAIASDRQAARGDRPPVTSEPVDIVTNGPAVEVANRAWWYARSQGFAAAAGDSVSLYGFYGGHQFETARITNLTGGATVVLRDDAGRPVWAARGT